MEEFLDFAFRNWFLFLALFVIIGLLIGNEVMHKLRGISTVNPNQALAIINHDEPIIVDVRDGGEYKAGHIREARHIPVAEVKQRLKELNKFKERPILLYCRSGNRAPSAAAVLKKQGFNQVHTLKGGLAAWQSANLPVSKK